MKGLYSSKIYHQSCKEQTSNDKKLLPQSICGSPSPVARPWRSIAGKTSSRSFSINTHRQLRFSGSVAGWFVAPCHAKLGTVWYGTDSAPGRSGPMLKVSTCCRQAEIKIDPMTRQLTDTRSHTDSKHQIQIQRETHVRRQVRGSS